MSRGAKILHSSRRPRLSTGVDVSRDAEQYSTPGIHSSQAALPAYPNAFAGVGVVPVAGSRWDARKSAMRQDRKFGGSRSATRCARCCSPAHRGKDAFVRTIIRRPTNGYRPLAHVFWDSPPKNASGEMRGPSCWVDGMDAGHEVDSPFRAREAPGFPPGPCRPPVPSRKRP